MRNDQIFVLLLVILLPMSGCFDDAVGDAEGTDDANAGTTVINNYYNNSTTAFAETIWYTSGTTNHTCIAQPGTQTSQDGYNWCYHDDNSLTDEWIRTQNYTVIHQDVNTAIDIIQYSGHNELYHVGIGTVCANGMIAGWNFDNDAGEEYDNTWSYNSDFLPFAGLDCNHYLYGQVLDDRTVNVMWHVSYKVVDLNQGPHN